jgi:hypothetical protein
MTYPAEPPRRKPRPRRRGLAGILAATAVAATAAGCGSHAAAPAAAASSAATHLAAQGAAPSCKQQYSAWKQGPARAQAQQLTSVLNAVQMDADSKDVPAMMAGLKTAGAAATRLDQYPIPACADPRGYWNAVLARIRAAGDITGSASGRSALILAEAPLKDVPGLQSKLTAELKRTA